MSRFFRAIDSSDSESDYSSSSSDGDFSDDELQQQQQQQQPQQQQKTASGATALDRFAMNSDDSDDEDTKRVVKSAKDKFAEQIISLSKDALSAIPGDEWDTVSNNFDQVNKVIPKFVKADKKQNIPRVYFRLLLALEDTLYDSNIDKSDLKKLNANNARGFNQLKQRARKHNKGFQSQIADYKANPVHSDDDEGNEGAVKPGAAVQDQTVPSSSRSGAKASSGKRGKKASAAAAGSDSEDDSEDSYWDSDSGSESDESSESEDEGTTTIRLARWLIKKPARGDGASAAKSKKEKAQRKIQAAKQAAATAAAQAGEDGEDDGFTTVGKGGKVADKPVYTSETVNKTLVALAESRGRRRADNDETIKILETLLGVCSNPLQEAKVLMALTSAQFDSAPATGYLPIKVWHQSKETLGKLLTLLEANHQITISETGDIHDEDDDVFKYKSEKITLAGSVIAFVDRLDDEFTKSLQSIDPHTPEYVERMRDTMPLYMVIVRAQNYFERNDLKNSLCRIALRRLEHLYYRTDQVNVQVEAAVADLPYNTQSTIVPPSIAGDVEAVINHLCTFLYLHADPLLRSRAMLMQIFNHALHKRYFVARDLMLMSHIQENVHQADVNTQVLYNRAIAQLGMAAFRLGRTQESFEHLVELMSSGYQRELLAQGVGQQRTQRQPSTEEQLQRQRQLPFHVNINLELLECVFLVVSMLLEIPAMAMATANPESRRAPISRVFRRMLDFNERQVFLGPPENTRDHIMAASKALAAGDWEGASELIKGIKIWALLSDSEEITDMLTSKIQVEALRTYLFTYSTQFESVGVEDLAAMFSMPQNKVYALLARMAYHGEVQASLDEVSKVLIFNKANFEAASHLQQTALALTNKANALADINERVFELKINGGVLPGDRQQQQQQQQQQGGGGSSEQVGGGGDRAGSNRKQASGGGGGKSSHANKSGGGGQQHRNNNRNNNNNNNNGRKDRRQHRHNKN